MAPALLSGCALCATLGRTCCQSREILVTEGDKSRIAKFTGEQAFWEDACPNDPDYLDQDDDPNWIAWAFRPDGSRPILKRESNGDCRFLNGVGCVLPLEVRPLVCRLFPYAYTERGLNGIVNECPREVVPTGQTILQVLDMRQADAIRWYRMLYTELRTKEPWDADWADLRPAG